MAKFQYVKVPLLLVVFVSGSLSRNFQGAEDSQNASPSDVLELDRLMDQQIVRVNMRDTISLVDKADSEELLPIDSTEQVNSSETTKTAGGAIYTRWGSSSCIDGSTLIYSGTAAGSYYTEVGGGSNYLCMPHEPIYDEYVTSADSDRARLYSSEYILSAGPSRLDQSHQGTPTCAVCRAPSGHHTQMMIPGRNECPSTSWRLEYKGYLMAERISHGKTEYICMDRDMEAEPGTVGSQGGAYFYFVESRCLVGGGLPCYPYVDGYELTCAVCTI